MMVGAHCKACRRDHDMWTGLQWALVSALDEVQQSFACEGRLAGSTATIVLQARLLPCLELLFCIND